MTTEQFGARQSRIYRNTLLQAIGELAAGSDIVGSKARDEVIRGLRTLHVARHGRRGSHFLMYRVAEAGTIEIIRILHDRMDLSGTFLLRTTIAPIAGPNPATGRSWKRTMASRNTSSGWCGQRLGLGAYRDRCLMTPFRKLNVRFCCDAQPSCSRVW